MQSPIHSRGSDAKQRGDFPNCQLFCVIELLHLLLLSLGLRLPIRPHVGKFEKDRSLEDVSGCVYRGNEAFFG